MILTERESSEAWLRSWVGMLDEYYTHHRSLYCAVLYCTLLYCTVLKCNVLDEDYTHHNRSRFHRLLPWLSDTHNKLGE